MCSKTIAVVATPEQTQSGCCCGTSSYAQKSSRAETRTAAATDALHVSFQGNADVRSEGCCCEYLSVKARSFAPGHGM